MAASLEIVEGGDWYLLSGAALEPGRAIGRVTCAEAGGVDVFIGTTRAETHAEHGKLVALDYAAYETMAMAEMRRLGAAARGTWPVCRLAILHRVGRVEVGQASVVIAVSCGHRAAAFEACRFLIDELKKAVPIWKNDLYEGGGNLWHHGG